MGKKQCLSGNSFFVTQALGGRWEDGELSAFLLCSLSQSLGAPGHKEILILADNMWGLREQNVLNTGQIKPEDQWEVLEQEVKYPEYFRIFSKKLNILVRAWTMGVQ